MAVKEFSLRIINISLKYSVVINVVICNLLQYFGTVAQKIAFGIGKIRHVRVILYFSAGGIANWIMTFPIVSFFME